jgi:hypothetical protein
MLGPNYGEWRNERPAIKRVRASIVALPVVVLALWAFYMLDARVNSEIFAAVERGDIGEVRGLMERGASVRARDGKFRTALHLAVETGDLDLVALLVAETPGAWRYPGC